MKGLRTIQNRKSKIENPRRGISRVEVLVLLVLFVVTVLFLLVAIPHGRENARLASCQLNMALIGKALGEYEQSRQTLPEVGALAEPNAPRDAQPPGPLRMMLETLQAPSFFVFKDPKTPYLPQPGSVPGEEPVPGFVCSSDPNATAGRFKAPISYRATTGDDPPGTNGSFAPGRVQRLADVEAGDGRSYTAAFSERLVGDNKHDHATFFNYRLLSLPPASSACPDTPDPAGWWGDAGSSWFSSGYRSTLYNHALPPGGQPSCLALNGKTAFMGASSGHAGSEPAVARRKCLNHSPIDRSKGVERARAGLVQPKARIEPEMERICEWAYQRQPTNDNAQTRPPP